METRPFAHFLVAAPHSGAGKTTLTLGLLRAFQNRGLRVQPFKCGPDFIDPIHHTRAACRQSINLDPFMMSTGHICQLYRQYTTDADIAITEGVMGLFDGSQKREGSSADLAILLNLPVILILDANAMAYSAAALLYGLKNFDSALTIAGAIFNFVDSPAHYRILAEACDDTAIKALGYLPANDELHIPSRHLGLDTNDSDDVIDAAARHIEKHLDVEAILNATRTTHPKTVRAPGPNPPTPMEAPAHSTGARTILVARDAAFAFLYAENLRRLEQYGRLEFFSPLSSSHLPPAHLLYLPGGYPELFLEHLAANQSLLADIRHYAASGGAILAECGGMMYLGRTITGEDGVPWSMTGILGIDTSLQTKKLHLGYRTVQINDKVLRGHEFHYSQFLAAPAPDPRITVRDAQGRQIPTPFFYRHALFASYLHFYWGESPGPLQDWLANLPA